MLPRPSAAALLYLIWSAAAPAALPPEQVEFFENRIRPVLAQECYECHSTAGKKKGGLLLDHRAGWQKGGNSGDAIIPGDPAASLLLQTIRHTEPDLEMPRQKAKLEERVLQDFEKWIKMGAPDPRDAPPTKAELEKDTNWPAIRDRRKAAWWSFQPVQNPPLPEVKNAVWSDHPIDRFLLAKMEAASLTPAEDADPTTILRRLSFILTGLPPTPDEVETVARRDASNSPLSTYLASPRYGERWARHWMDWMRYAETHGSEGDPAIPHAWRYRDYLIRALNADIPYPQLVREHLAGDLLENPRTDTTNQLNESALGPAHLRMVLHGFTPTDALDEQATFIDNQIDTVTKAFLGLTVSCARCHDHKFDPISQADFYALYGIFASCRPATIDLNSKARETHDLTPLRAAKTQLRQVIADAWRDALPETIADLRTWQPQDQDDKTRLLEGDASPLAAWLRLTALPEEKWDAEWQRLRQQWTKSREQLAAFRAQPALLRWDLRQHEDFQKWSASGAALTGPTPAGETTFGAPKGRAVVRILPAGVHSDLASAKDRAVFASPRFDAQGGKLWLHVRGDAGAVARYVVRDYPRSGLIYPKAILNGDRGKWVSWPLDYWKGDRVHVELTTGGDHPVELGAERSSFGVTEALYLPDEAKLTPPAVGTPLLALCDEPAPRTRHELAARYASALQRCIAAWRRGEMTDDEAAFLDFFAARDLLPNFNEALPTAAPALAEYRRLEALIPAPTRAPGVLEGFAFDQPLFTRGDHKKPTDPVPRRFLEALDPTPFALDAKRSGRREFAESLVARGNPLTSRVLVNRLWHYVFGQGLVTTPDNFGRLGEPPSHPELLDYLATRFDADGGSIKSMLRLMVTSRAFRLAHRPSPEAADRDPQNRLLTHFATRRLEAEAIRDSLLFLTGKLDATSGGPPADANSHRRSVYLKVIRNNLDPFLSAFDWPVPASPRGRRDSTNVPAQSLALLNDPNVAKWSAEWSQRLLTLPTDEARLQRLYLEAFARPPTSLEIEQCLTYLRADLVLKPADAWRSLAHALINTKEFIYLR